MDAAVLAAAALGSAYVLDEQFRKGTPPADPTTSIIIHGTAAWAQSWWLTGGDFHTYILQEVRPDLFSGHNAFQWNGAYKKKTRNIAAEQLAGWLETRLDRA